MSKYPARSVAVEDVIDGTTEDGIESVKDTVFVPIVVEPFFVTQVIVHVELVLFVKYGANVAIAGVQLTEAPTLELMVPDLPAHDHDTVWVNDDDFRFVSIVIVDPSCFVPETVGTDARGIVVKVNDFDALIVPAEVIVTQLPDAEILAVPVDEWLTVNVFVKIVVVVFLPKVGLKFHVLV